MTYALLDASTLIERRHLEAAEAVWDHCVETVYRVFSDQQPDHVVAILLTALRAAGPRGLDGTQQQDLFHRHQPAHRLAAARVQLERQGIAHTIAEETGGRPRIITRLAVTPDEGISRDLPSLPWPHHDREQP